ncbi:hypothetical protein L208DRAFT_921338 [Tricholoma matsutake]|nr:hypothetical protein L208DRAFT_921338 [Tricholoma matsutake 945]
MWEHYLALKTSQQRSISLQLKYNLSIPAKDVAVERPSVVYNVFVTCVMCVILSPNAFPSYLTFSMVTHVICRTLSCTYMCTCYSFVHTQ